MLFAFLLPALVLAQSYNETYPSNATYSDVTAPYNQRFEWKPALVATPLDAAGVSAAVRGGHEQGIPVVARSGGHSYVANGLGGEDGAMVVDLRNLKDITFNSDNTEVTLGTGLRLGDIYLALSDKGKAIAAGSCALVGLGGHAAFGGFGFQSRELGQLVDQIVSIDAVLANGTMFTANNDTNQDLFYALRGAASSFAITTSITLRTSDAPKEATNFVYTWDLTAEAATDLMSKYQDFAQTAANPKELGSQLTFGKGSSQGRVRTTLTGAWYGATSAFERVVQPFVSQFPEAEKKLTQGAWVDIARAMSNNDNKLKTDEEGAKRQDTFYAKSLMTPEAEPMNQTVISAFITYLAQDGFNTDLQWFTQVELWGGHDSAISAVAKEDTAFYNRDTLFTFQFYASSSDYAPPFPDYGYSFLDNMVDSIVNNSSPDWDYGAYLNYIDDRLIENDYRWKELYYGYAYDTLTILKAQVDPNNTFRFPGSVALLDLGATHLADADKVKESSASGKAISIVLAGAMLLFALCV